jgi:protein-tyrosine-phosphatase
VAGADLVLAMERQHLREAIVLVPEAEPWSFTLRDAVRRAEAVPPRSAGETVRAWARRLADGRSRADLFGSGDDGIADPMGRSRRHYVRAAADIDDLLLRLVARVWTADVATGRAPAVRAPAGSQGPDRR